MKDALIRNLRQSKDEEARKLNKKIKSNEKDMEKIIRKLWFKKEEVWNHEKKINETMVKRELELTSMIKFVKEQIKKLQDYKRTENCGRRMKECNRKT